MPNPPQPSAEDPQQPWYEKGLQFQCSECGDCCTGAPGYVWINQAEVDALASGLGISNSELEERFVRQIGIRRSLTEHSNGDCVFFDNKTRKCKVYEDRPRQCRTWPFWKSNLKTPQSWGETCEICPGSGQGKLHQIESIEKQASVVNV